MKHLNDEILTGFVDLDRLTGGLKRSNLIVVASQTSVGKTSLALSIAYNTAARYHNSVAIFSLEMSREQIAQRLVSMDSGIDSLSLRTDRIEEDEWDRIIYSIDTLSEAKIWIDAVVGTSAEIRSKARHFQAEHDVDLIIVDYLQLIESSARGRHTMNRVRELSEISHDLKELAVELDLPVMVVAQLSSGVEDRQSKIPQLSDLHECGSLVQDADLVMFIYRNDVYNPESDRKNIADIIVAKHLGGPVGQVSVYFQASYTLFRDLETLPPVE